MVTITTPQVGRGAWPATGTGGTLSLDGLRPGRFYRAPLLPSVDMPGRAAWAAIRLGLVVDVNDYAVHLAVKAIQIRCGLVADGLFGLVADGLFGPNTTAAATNYQHRYGLAEDGVVGSTTTRHMFKPVIGIAVSTITDPHPRLSYLVGGHIAYESGFDPGAVGVTTPVDLGLGQINGPAHPSLTIEQRFDPTTAISFTVALVEANLDAFPRRETDAIAAYNLGISGTRSWITAGRPQLWGTTDTTKYINAILTAAATVQDTP